MSKNVHKPAEFDGLGWGGGDRRRQPEPGFERNPFKAFRPVAWGLILFWLAVAVAVCHYW